MSMTNADEINSHAVSPVSTLGGGGADWTEGCGGISIIGSFAHTPPAIKKLSISSRIVIFFISPLLPTSSDFFSPSGLFGFFR
jgi:hypothetical protein